MVGRDGTVGLPVRGAAPLHLCIQIEPARQRRIFQECFVLCRFRLAAAAQPDKNTSVGAFAARILSSVGQIALCILLLLVTVITTALLAILPVLALPGELQMEFVHDSWITIAMLGIFGLALAHRVAPLGHGRAEKRISRLWAARFFWAAISTVVPFAWTVGLLTWVNGYDVAETRSHDMVVTGFSEVRSSPGSTASEYATLTEIGTGWTADLEVDGEEDPMARRGSCVRITVGEGRLGLDWMGDARPIRCPARSAGPAS